MTAVRPVRPRTSRSTTTTALALAFGLTGLGTAAPLPSAAQEAPQAGARIRVVAHGADRTVEGRLVSWNETTLVYELPEGERVQMDRHDVQSIETARLRRHTGAGLVVGALTGGFVLGMVAAATYEEPSCSGWPCVQLFSRGDVALAGALGGALGGGLLGALIGRSTTSESWETVVAPGPAGPGSVGLGVRLRF